MKEIICIIGKTSSGKDTLANYIKKVFGIESICSYTTRAKRINETDGVEHYFISDVVADKKLKEENVIAYTKNDDTGIRYFTTLEQMSNDVMVYIINPDGVAYLEDTSGRMDFKLHTIYVDLDEDTILKRAELRGDNMEITRKRLDSEREEFDEYKNSKAWDYYISTDKAQCYVETEINAIMQIILQDTVDKA